MIFQRFITKTFEYLHGVRVIKDHVSLDLKLPEGWVVLKSHVEGIEVLPSENQIKDSKFKIYSLVCKNEKDGLENLEKTFDNVIKYNLEKQEIVIFRIGFPGLKKEIYLKYFLRDVKSLKLTISEGLNPKREIYLLTKDKKQIPLTRVGEPLLLSQIEIEAVELAKYLKVNLES